MWLWSRSGRHSMVIWNFEYLWISWHGNNFVSFYIWGKECVCAQSPIVQKWSFNLHTYLRMYVLTIACVSGGQYRCVDVSMKMCEMSCKIVVLAMHVRLLHNNQILKFEGLHQFTCCTMLHNIHLSTLCVPLCTMHVESEASPPTYVCSYSNWADFCVNLCL